MAITSVNTGTTTTSNPSQNYRGPLTMVTALFFMWGFITSLNDILVPHLKSIFELKYVEVMLVQFAFFTSYFVFALPAGKLIEWIGYKRTMVTGLFTMGVGALLFIPAASIPSFPLFLGALIVVAAGMTALQTSANPYVSVLGPAATASSRLNLAQAFNSLGTTIAPPLGSLLILSSTAMSQSEIHKLSNAALQAYRIQEASSVKVPYLMIALALILLALAIATAKLPSITATQEFRPTPGGKPLMATSIWSYRHLVLGALGIFLYVGAEVAIGSFLVNYFSQPDIGGLTEKRAAFFVAFYWGGAMVGRFIGSALLQRMKPSKLLGINALVACLLVAISILTTGHVAMWSIIAVGLFNSIMFPTIFTLGIAELGPLTGKGSGLMIAAIVGGAIIPEIEGAFADHIGIHTAFVIPALCYLYIAYYGFRGSKPHLAAS